MDIESNGVETMWENRRDEFVDISEKELKKILVDVRDKEDIILTNHSIKKINERPLKFEWIYNMFNS